jgi:hypothetical protein
VRSRRILALVIVIWLVGSACSQPGSDPTAVTNQDSDETVDATGEAGETPGSGAGETTTVEVEPGSESLALILGLEDFDASLAEEDPINSPVEDAGLILGGAPNATAAALIADQMEQAGVDLSNLQIQVLPITGTGTSVLVMEVSEENLLSPDGDQSGELNLAISDLPGIEEAHITHLVVITSGESEQGSYVMTTLVAIADLERAESSGEELTIGENLFIQVEETPR